MPMNATGRCTRNLVLVELLFQATGAARRKLHPSGQYDRESKIRRRIFQARRFGIVELNAPLSAGFLVEQNKVPEQRYVAQPGFGPVLHRKPFWPLEGAVNHRNIQLHSETRCEAVTNDQ